MFCFTFMLRAQMYIMRFFLPSDDLQVMDMAMAGVIYHSFILMILEVFRIHLEGFVWPRLEHFAPY